MPEIATYKVGDNVLTERERLAEIAKIARNQLSHDVDLPKSPQVLINGSRLSIKEIPMPPEIIAFHVGTGGGLYLPEAERTYVRGRVWTI